MSRNMPGRSYKENRWYNLMLDDHIGHRLRRDAGGFLSGARPGSLDPGGRPYARARAAPLISLRIAFQERGFGAGKRTGEGFGA